MDKQAVTIYDVAREAGVSMATVSRVVNGNPNVKPATRKKVSDVIERLNYRPNAVARGLASKKTTTIGVIIPDITNLFFAELAKGIEDIATMYKYNIILTSADANQHQTTQAVDNLLNKQVDGIIFMDYDIEPDLISMVKTVNTPVVLSGTYTRDKEIPSVNIDYKQATYEVAKDLLTRHEAIALVTGDSQNAVIEDMRLPGYLKAIEEAGSTPDERLIIQKHRPYEKGDDILRSLIADGAGAVITTDDRTAVSLLNAALDQGIKVPEDFEIYASNNCKLTTYVRPQLSSIQVPLYDIGAVAMRLLTKIMDKEEVDEKQIILPHKIIKRQSTR